MDPNSEIGIKQYRLYHSRHLDCFNSSNIWRHMFWIVFFLGAGFLLTTIPYCISSRKIDYRTTAYDRNPLRAALSIPGSPDSVLDQQALHLSEALKIVSRRFKLNNTIHTTPGTHLTNDDFKEQLFSTFSSPKDFGMYMNSIIMRLEDAEDLHDFSNTTMPAVITGIAVLGLLFIYVLNILIQVSPCCKVISNHVILDFVFPRELVEKWFNIGKYGYLFTSVIPRSDYFVSSEAVHEMFSKHLVSEHNVVNYELNRIVAHEISKDRKAHEAEKRTAERKKKHEEEEEAERNRKKREDDEEAERNRKKRVVEKKKRENDVEGEVNEMTGLMTDANS